HKSYKDTIVPFSLTSSPHHLFSTILSVVCARSKRTAVGPLALLRAFDFSLIPSFHLPYPSRIPSRNIFAPTTASAMVSHVSQEQPQPRIPESTNAKTYAVPEALFKFVLPPHSSF